MTIDLPGAFMQAGVDELIHLRKRGSTGNNVGVD
jgi:hypothetical protein